MNRRETALLRKFSENLRLGNYGTSEEELKRADFELAAIKTWEETKKLKLENNKAKTKAIGEKIRTERDK